MNKKAFYHAIIAAGYITILVSVVDVVSRMLHSHGGNIFMPISMLTLLVLSVAVMAFLFFYEPVLLLIEGKRSEAVKLLFSTIAIFALFAIGFFAIAFFVIP